MRPGDEVPDPVPESLGIVGLSALPCQPLPPRLLPADVPKPFGPKEVAAFAAVRGQQRPPTREEADFRISEDEADVLKRKASSGLGEEGISPIVLQACEPGAGSGAGPGAGSGAGSVVSVVKRAEDEDENDFNLLRSIFTQRTELNDGSSYFCTPEVTLRGFEIDFSRANGFGGAAHAPPCQTGAGIGLEPPPLAKAPSFRAAVGADSPELLLRIQHVLRRHRSLLYSLFAVYASVSGKLHRMTFDGWFALVFKANVVDEKLSSDELVRIFRRADAEAKVGDNEMLQVDDRVFNMSNEP